MYIAILTDPKLIQQMQEYETKSKQEKSEDSEELEDVNDDSFKNSPLFIMKKAIESYDNQVEFLSLDDNLYNLLQVGKFDLIINTADKLDSSYNPANYAGMFEISKIPYCASKMTAIGLVKDRSLFKSLLRLNHIATAPFQKIKFQPGKIPSIKTILKFPIVIKYYTEGIHNRDFPDQICHEKKELQAILENQSKKHEYSYALLEEYIPGKKYYLPIIGNELNENIRFLPMVEYTYPTVQDPTEKIGTISAKPEINFIERTNSIVKRARDVAVKASNFYNCRDYTMAVFLQDERNDNLLLHELNPLTSLLPNGKLNQSADHIGENYEELINEIILFTLLRYKLKIRGKYAKKLKDIMKE